MTHQNTGLRQRNTVRKRACGGRTTSTLRVLAAAKSPIWFFKPPKIKPLSPTASGARQAIGRRLGEKCQQASGSPSRRQATRAVTDRARGCVRWGKKVETAKISGLQDVLFWTCPYKLSAVAARAHQVPQGRRWPRCNKLRTGSQSSARPRTSSALPRTRSMRAGLVLIGGNTDVQRRPVSPRQCFSVRWS